MALKSFAVQGVKALALAKCESVPPVMVIAGPNGVGKSTLLYEISQQRGVVADSGTKFLYQPPHRAIRKTVVHRKWLMGGQQNFFADLLSRPDVSGFEGLSFSFPSRAPDNVDEAGSTIKYTLGKIENKRQNTLAELVDKSQKQNKSVETKDIPDIYKPIKDLTKYLLPHLTFARVDFQNEDNIRCIWKRKDRSGEIELDIDDLSSGEKSIIILFLPLIENEINNLLKKITNLETEYVQQVVQEDRVLIIDEPELHIHPDLQTKILTYLRTLAGTSRIQFIVSTHSPTILDQALDSELFVLGFKNEDATVNQLKQVASNLDRLEALKQLAGDAYLVTTGRSIICIEGDSDVTARPADIRLFQILYPRSTAFTFIPAGGKGEVIKIVNRLREYLPEGSFGIKIYGLVDMDQSDNQVSGVFTIPVCMIENLLINEGALFSYLQSNDITDLSSNEAVLNELTSIATSFREDEISYRLMRGLGSRTVRLRGNDVNSLKEKLHEELQLVQSLLPKDEELAKQLELITSEVDRIIQNKQTLQLFRGKAILGKFYEKHIKEKNIPYSEFCYELARLISEGTDVGKVLNPIFDQMS